MSFTIPVNIAVSMMNDRVPFLQPLYETITNSLEANATEIKISLELDTPQLEDGDGKIAPSVINGFTIEDNGTGFTAKSMQSFGIFRSDHKKELGCKGIGRVTWLKVFNRATVISVAEGKEVSINYDLNFDPSTSIKTKPTEEQITYTKITFYGVTDHYWKIGKSGYDKRQEADLGKIKDLIQEHLLAKLTLFAKNNKTFRIEITNDGTQDSVIIEKTTIPQLTQKNFEIQDFQNKKHSFELLYSFIEDNRGHSSLFYCANGRTVSSFPKSMSLKSLPGQDSAIMLVSSDYLDHRVNDERNEFTFGDTENKRSLTNPLVAQDIHQNLRPIVEKVVVEKYPVTTEKNDDVIAECSKEFPYLAKYIKRDTSVIKRKNDIIDTAKKAFNEEKERVQKDFAKMLKERDVDDEKFYQTLSDVRDISARELAEYIVYRQQIILALEELIKRKAKQEDLLHKLFMPQRTSANIKDGDFPVLDNNIWLLDDKFMSYNFAASDKTIKTICDELQSRSTKIYRNTIRPDMSIFYSTTPEEHKDVVVIEFKAIDATEDEKGKALWELSRNIDVIRKNIPHIKQIWAYIITQIDKEFAETLGAEGYDKLFTNDDENKVFYAYKQNKNDGTAAHIYVVSTDAIVADSKARNKVFLDLLAKEVNE